MRLLNKVALITGGTSGIGEATALLFANEGAKVTITGRNEERGSEVTDLILKGDGQAIFIQTDVSKAMAIDHGRQGIRVNCICPGDVDTPMLPEDARLRGLNWDKYLAGCANRPMGRIGTPDEIAKAALFLASDDSSFMTGAALVVDGGGTAD